MLQAFALRCRRLCSPPRFFATRALPVLARNQLPRIERRVSTGGQHNRSGGLLRWPRGTQETPLTSLPSKHSSGRASGGARVVPSTRPSTARCLTMPRTCRRAGRASMADSAPTTQLSSLSRTTLARPSSWTPSRAARASSATSIGPLLASRISRCSKVTSDFQRSSRSRTWRRAGFHPMAW